MAETKFTPGPWYSVGHNWHETSVYSKTTEQCICTMDTEGWGVTEETQDEFEAIQTANAHLIKEAPNLYAVLTDARAQIEHLHRKLPTGTDAATLTRIDATLTRARGEG